MIDLPNTIRETSPSITSLYNILAARAATPPIIQETHGAWVVLTEEQDGGFAYKLKKPVAFPYMDYSTPERRKALSEREIELNSRTAAPLYIGVFALTDNDILPIAEAPEKPLDCLVKMHRFEQENLLSNIAENGKMTQDLLADLSQQLITFHQNAEKFPRVDGVTPILDTIKGNDGMFATFGKQLDRTASSSLTVAQLAMAEALTAPLNDRAANGWVRQCHGDLYLNNICLWAEGDATPQPLLFDCIEFNDAFAVIDTQYDIAFLLMDLHFRDMPNAASMVQQLYEDALPMVSNELWPLLISIRAAIRSHVSVAMGDIPLAQRYLTLALNSVQYPQRFGAALAA